jgi:ubiquinone biosynthesis protein
MRTVPSNSRASVAERIVRGPSGFRQLLPRLGPTFTKLGQYLALRPDLIPQEYADELMLLQDQAPPFPWPEARAILTQDLGAEPTEIFAHINPRPMAAGSLAQTHLARLADGAEVAVKIQRPNIRALVLRDLRRARLLARLLKASGASLVASPLDVVEELTDSMLQVIDMGRELANVTRLHELTRGSYSQRVPQPYPDLSGRRVLTVEYLGGVLLTEILVALRSGRREEAERVDRFGIDRRRLATSLLAATLTQIFHYQFFQADTHPGNLLALPGDAIGFVDFGLCGDLDQTVRKRQLSYLAAIYADDAEQMFRALIEIVVPGEGTDLAAFRREFFEETGRCLGGMRTGAEDDERDPHGLRRPPIARCMTGVMHVARRNGLQIPATILSQYRALLTAETVAHEAVRDFDLRSVGRDFFGKLQVEEAIAALDPESLRPTVLSLVTLLRDWPGDVHHVLSELADGTFKLNAYVVDTPGGTQVRNRRARLLAVSILSVGVAMLLTIPQLPKVLGISLAWLLSGALTLLYIVIFFQWKQLR